MSITVGIDIHKKDPVKDKEIYAEKGGHWRRPGVSWKRWYVESWINQWLYHYMTQEKPEYYKRFGKYEYEVSMPKDDLLRMADDLINRRFDVCSDAHEDFEGVEQWEQDMVWYGEVFKELAERLRDDELLVYYDHGN